jgi:hypothetical protein
MKRQRFLPQVEELGHRVLPSALTLAHVPEAPRAMAASTLPPQYKHPLAGKGSGAFSTDLIPSDAGATYHLHGSAKLAGLGEVVVYGSLHAVGFTSSGRASGTLTLFGNGGSVTVEFQGPVQPGFSKLPHYFHYHIVRGTGAYLHLQDSGTLRLDPHPFPTAGPAVGKRGSFSLWI